MIQAYDNATGCSQDEYHPVECLAESPCACENVKVACQDEWHRPFYCRHGGGP